MTNDRKVTHEYAYVFESIDGDRYAARAAGSARPDAKFDGWIEFVDITGRRLATEVETVQPNERAFRYWAAGLTAIYLEGAFDRAAACVSEESPRRVPQKRAALDPFEVDIQGEGILAARLSELDLDDIREIATGYELMPPEMAASASRDEIIVEVLAGVSSARREPAMR